MGATKSRFKRKHSSLRKSVQTEQEATAPKIVLLTGHSHRMNLAIALPLAEDPLSSFKVLVTVPSLSSSEYLGDPRVLNLLNKTLFVLQMDIESDESINGVLREIMDNDGFIDAVGEFCHRVLINHVFTCYYLCTSIAFPYVEIRMRILVPILSRRWSFIYELLPHFFVCVVIIPYVTITASAVDVNTSNVISTHSKTYLFHYQECSFSQIDLPSI